MDIDQEIKTEKPGVKKFSFTKEGHQFLKVAFGFFFIAALLGVLLRVLMVWPMGLNYKYFLHTHSHVMFLGWVFNALYAGFLISRPLEDQKAKRYQRLFWLLQLAVLGMLFSFPFQGYALFSITFSTLHIFLSYYFCWKYYKDAGLKQQLKHSPGALLIALALLFHLIGTIGPFALGPLMAKGLSGSQWYYLAIYHYLHFEYNGLFTFGVFGIFFSWLEAQQIVYSRKGVKIFIRATALACIPAFALSALWTEPPLWLWLVAAVSAVVQLIGLVSLLKVFYLIRHELKSRLLSWAFSLYSLALAAFVLKNILQAASAFPAVALLADANRHITIAYLHLVFIGFVTLALIAWSIQQKFMQSGRAFRWGILFFLSAFLLSEAMLVAPQLAQWIGVTFILPVKGLIWVSAFLPLAVGLLWYSVIYAKKGS
jgi:hypothetical protein